MTPRRILAVGTLLLLTACGPRPVSGSPDTVVVMAAETLPGQKGDTHYAQVRHAWLADFYTRWRADLFRKGVVKWDARFDCNRFAGHFVSAAQVEYFIANFHSWTAGQALALGEFWYLPDGAPARHAVVIAFTDKGVVFIEPQTGQEMVLTTSERASASAIRF